MAVNIAPMTWIFIQSILVIQAMAITDNTSIICDPGINCILDTNQLTIDSLTYINALNATSLTVHCYNKTCMGSSIHCPTLHHSNCSIVCHDDRSCAWIVLTAFTNSVTIESLSDLSLESSFINAVNAREINVNCLSNQSCQNLFVRAANAHNITIFCPTMAGYKESCSRLTINATFANHIILTCGNGAFIKDISAGSCPNLKLYAAHALHVDVIAYDIAYGLIYAQNATNFNLTCISKWRYDGCYHLDIFFPSPTPQGVTTFNCYGSCEILDIFDTSCTALHAINIHLNGCGVTQDVFRFIVYWAFYLTDGKTIGPQNSFHSNRVSGDSFGCWPWQDERFIAQCNCSDIEDIVTSAYINDVSREECRALNTLHPTRYPTDSPVIHPTMQPSHAPTYAITHPYSEASTTEEGSGHTSTDSANLSSSTDNGADQILFIVLVLVSVVGLIVIGLFVWWFRSQCFHTNKHQTVVDVDNQEVSENDEALMLTTQSAEMAETRY
eukprot:348962_1